jgi:hypothetical protein
MFEKMYIIHFEGLNALNMQKNFWFALNFEHWNFGNNEFYSKNKY